MGAADRELRRRRATSAVAGVALLLSALLVMAAAHHRLPLDLPETAGVLAGAWTVSLTAARSLWTWPVGILGSLVFAGVFWRSGLYGAMGMQVLYTVLGIAGWYCWRGGRRQDPPPVAPAPLPVLLTLTVAVGVITPVLTLSLHRAHDIAPALDALATLLSLAAQFLVMRKWVENWYFWIAADLAYALLNATHGLSLFACLYLIHLGVCAGGLWQWRRACRLQTV